ncbi:MULTISPECIES: TadE family protein [unclassified Streptomyces]|uniref:TadE family protein n=1 Tax=unclassified Streptomyces TaxID=2593676 RepID=UPI00225B9E0E|nr:MULTISPECIES: TadE/TadG family type IV pilus assembly protein [unclassified Streptomyces]WSP53161.1 pilus assembly protein [Streptomyces sp. NBC_01241]WSU26120.1 pilus assembly protein [Streptomyces sp. NBC_01108]MCX4799492.1 pilus assembly protein [Streptomyces sp. NBC_01242]WSJ40684.1 pilus assembly protein [Streptomyces sp. NBC_01321]WSP67003.1 pilus assembly protein [Streptomyces sp. NBC_01240]
MSSRMRNRLRAFARRRRLRGNDRGFGSVEFAVLAVVVLMLIFTAIQVGLYYHARKVAQSAARQGVEAGRAFGASEGDGVAQAQDFLAWYGNSVRGASVSSTGSTAQEIRITVRGSVATLVPGLELDVVQYADAPIERWTNP